MRADTPAYDLDIRTDEKRIRAALADAAGTPFWLEDPGRPAPEPWFTGSAETDLLVIGGGYCGLWTALQAKERDPARDVVLVESAEIGWAASGRNGGFVEASLTHGPENGHRHFADDLTSLATLAAENFREFHETLLRHGIDAEYEQGGGLSVATERHQVEALRRSPGRFYDRDELTELVRSPLYRAGVFRQDGIALVHPAKLVWGLKKAAIQAGVRVFEHTPVWAITDHGSTVRARTDNGIIRARQVALATNGFPSLLKRNRMLTLPVYDYVLMTEPLTPGQLDEIGWRRRFGISDPAVPLLPPDRRQPDPLGRLRRRLPPRRRHRPRPRPAARDVRPPRRPLPAHLPAARRHQVHPRLGRHDRHVHPAGRVPGRRDGRHGRLQQRLHRPRRSGDPLRRLGDARPAVRPRHSPHPPADGHPPPAAGPARAHPVPGRPTHPPGDRPLRPQRRPRRPDPEGRQPPGLLLRLLTMLGAAARPAPDQAAAVDPDVSCPSAPPAGADGPAPF
jgi:glycine/D-amino acid oxidase-like deaminating enzyme